LPARLQLFLEIKETRPKWRYRLQTRDLAVSSPRDAGHFAAVAVTLMIGTLWMANVLMVMAPFCLSRIERGVTKGGLLAGLLSLFPLKPPYFS
jgi:hypothetical protein